MNNAIQAFEGNIFLTKLSVINAVNLEQMIYQVADQSLPGYKGGQWQFIKTESGARYMRFPFEGEKDMNFMYNSATMSSDAAGIAMSLIAMSHFSFHLFEKNSPDTDSVSDMFHTLRAFALEHKEAQGILALID